MFLVILCIKLLKICNIYTTKSPDRPLSQPPLASPRGGQAFAITEWICLPNLQLRACPDDEPVNGLRWRQREEVKWAIFRLILLL